MQISDSDCTKSYSGAEYACPVWKASAHMKTIDIALKESCRTIIGYIGLTKLYKFYTLSSITITDIRRTAITEIEMQLRFKAFTIRVRSYENAP